MNGRTIEVTVAPDGSLSIDAVGFQGADCEKATRIDYDNDRGVWRVYDVRDGFPMFAGPTRRQCLEWEALHLGDGGPAMASRCGRSG